MRSYVLRAFVAIVLAGFAWMPAAAQEAYPSKPITMVIPFGAGGALDLVARVLADGMRIELGQPVIVENKPGASGLIAMRQVATAVPDGYTLLVGATGMAINQSLYSKLPYDSVRDFVAISELASFPLLMVVNANSPIKSVAELVAYAKANADKMNYASSSATFQLVTELFKQKTGAPMQAIPYKSANEMVLAVVSGQVTTTIADSGPVSPQVKAGTVRALAVTAQRRMAEFPDVPTMKEAGADVDAIIWTGVFAPKGTPPQIVKKLEGEFMKIARLPEVASRLKAIGVDAVGTSTEEFTKILQDDITRWGDVVKSANIKIEQ